MQRDFGGGGQRQRVPSDKDEQPFDKAWLSDDSWIFSPGALLSKTSARSPKKLVGAYRKDQNYQYLDEQTNCKSMEFDMMNIISNFNKVEFIFQAVTTYAASQKITVIREARQSYALCDSVTSDSEITIIDRFASSSSPCHSNSNYSEHCDRLREHLEQALIEREKLELQNEQLLKQWEEALEYVTTVQKQLQEEIRRNTELKNAQMEAEKSRHDTITISRSALNFIVLFAVFIAFYLYRI
ncbi:hypothetical protein Y032_0046g1310 [Ancylostoma ceylanicum]|uniref:Uncharacterized protein n=1 Tax=Ancylostoma ceylanicum TaxID=53326 RepID=A0A016UDD1_9BILA|nr:hypothetical protein Y032_0046g1310 [Ancylostoma ceylanicum]